MLDQQVHALNRPTQPQRGHEAPRPHLHFRIDRMLAWDILEAPERPLVIVQLCALLQQPRDTPYAALQRAYRAQVKRCHPDVLAPDADAEAAIAHFHALVAAWDRALPALKRGG
ncbi:hypothetical protein JKP88DRAFT_349626 [Tribonema minus]|uniref:J domain-containing protein n=1 Tax=Tribonema minus TaxID=303371 RepID=A0A836CBJ9_9STRA|nr:hypothetical protein JKP88DRAFT_349626 [Tribonema minus]